MPIREFKCPEGHVMEKILFGPEEEQPTALVCTQLVSMPGRRREHTVCNRLSRRVEFSMTAPAQFVEGNGGFHKPSIGALPTNHSSSSVREFIQENKLVKSTAASARKALKK